MNRSIRLLLATTLIATALAGGDASAGGPALRVLSTTDVGGSPSSLTTAAGDVWVSLGLDGVARLDGDTGVAVARIQPGGAVIGLASGYGAVWAIDVFGDRLLRIDPDTNTVTSETRVGGLPNGVTVGHGSVWVQNQLDSTVSRVDPATGRVSETVFFPPGELWPGGILATPSAVWIVTAAGNAVAEIEPDVVAHRPGAPRPRRTVARVRAWLRLGRACPCQLGRSDRIQADRAHCRRRSPDGRLRPEAGRRQRALAGANGHPHAGSPATRRLGTQACPTPARQRGARRSRRGLGG